MTTTEQINKLARAKELTRSMREHEQKIVAMNNERRELLREIWKDEGLSQREIAVVLGVTSQTIWNEIHRKEPSQQV
jgi:IS30 family transposase